VTPAALVLAEAERRLVARCRELGQRLDAGDAGDDVWREYTNAVAALTALLPAEQRPLVTTAQMAAHLGVSSKTVRKLGRAGKLDSLRLGKRGSAAIRWRSTG
jgi:excisionase family DNA binding protein